MKRPLLPLAIVPVLAAAWLATATPSIGFAQSTPPSFNRVEEDWELVIDQPDIIADGPQITTSLSPSSDPASWFFALNLNYRSQPSYESGGVEIVAFHGEQVLKTVTQHTAQLAEENETISWTQSMQLSGGTIEYEISGGQSTTWGNFGQGAGAVLSVQVATGLGTLDAYSPEISIARSGVSWQSNRVASMKLVRVRYYDGDQLVAIDETPRAVALSN